MRRINVFRGMFIGLPLVLFCWWMVYHYPKNHASFVWGNAWFGFYTTVVLVGYFWPVKRSKPKC